jgi:hypothetical protein
MGRFHFTNNTGAANPNLQVGIRGASGTIKIGDGIGAAGSAVLNLRDIVDGSANGANVSMNLAASEGGQPNGIAGSDCHQLRWLAGRRQSNRRQ